MEITLYAIPGSHPCATVEAALHLKGLDYQRVDLLPGTSALVQLARFGKRTVPGLVVDGGKVSGSRLILRTLEGLQPEPPLYPRDPEQAKAVDRPSAGATRACRPRPASSSRSRCRATERPATP